MDARIYFHREKICFDNTRSHFFVFIKTIFLSFARQNFDQAKVFLQYFFVFIQFQFNKFYVSFENIYKNSPES